MTSASSLFWLLLAPTALAVTSLNSACSSASSGSGAALHTDSCSTAGPLAGATYDITKSKFAFGSAPAAVDAGSLVRWTGSEGVVALFSDGSEMASLDANAPAQNLAGWSSKTETLAEHLAAYYEAMGVQSCQIANVGMTYSGGGGGSTDGGGSVFVAGPTTAILERAIDGISVVDSRGVAQFDVDDQTTTESFYWPEIPADVVAAARAFRDKLAAPGALAAFKAKLPADAQGDGSVVIHHHVAGSTGSFVAAVTYQTIQITPQNDGGDIYFDPNGQPMMDTWSGF
jgi:plastocyanin